MQKIDSSGFEVARYDFQLTDDGEIVAKEKAATHATLWERIRKAVQTLKDANAEDYVKLSIAAKSYFMQTNEKLKLSAEELSRRTSEYGWNVKPEEFIEADELLISMNLRPATS